VLNVPAIPETSRSSSSSAGEVAAIFVAIVLAAILLIAVIVIVLRRRKSQAPPLVSEDGDPNGRSNLSFTNPIYNETSEHAMYDQPSFAANSSRGLYDELPAMSRLARSGSLRAHAAPAINPYAAAEKTHPMDLDDPYSAALDIENPYALATPSLAFGANPYEYASNTEYIEANLRPVDEAAGYVDVAALPPMAALAPRDDAVGYMDIASLPSLTPNLPRDEAGYLDIAMVNPGKAAP
jgi:hypothetical protein